MVYNIEDMCKIIIVKMDASPVQSGSKCGGSDFSIERILSDRSDSDDVKAPEWLCCTRYRPPRLPRAPSCRARRAGRHARVPFTAAQAAALEAAYRRAPYLAPPALKALAAALNLRDDRIKIWFQNRRARERREKSVTISPPQAVALPPTATGIHNPWISQAQSSFVSAQAFISPRRFVSPANFVSSGKSYLQMHNLQASEEMRGRIFPSVSVEDDVDRPGTPLDIETVED